MFYSRLRVVRLTCVRRVEPEVSKALILMTNMATAAETTKVNMEELTTDCGDQGAALTARPLLLTPSIITTCNNVKGTSTYHPLSAGLTSVVPSIFNTRGSPSTQSLYRVGELWVVVISSCLWILDRVALHWTKLLFT